MENYTRLQGLQFMTTLTVLVHMCSGRKGGEMMTGISGVNGDFLNFKTVITSAARPDNKGAIRRTTYICGSSGRARSINAGS